MGDEKRQKREERIKPHLPILRNNGDPKISNKQQLLHLMQDLKDEGNTLFKEEKFRDAWQHYCFALLCARQLERTFYFGVEKEFLATLFCNASLCCLRTENFEEALKDADMALCCQKNNVKAMYRRAVALKELGRHKEALEQATQGQQLDNKKDFGILIEELKQLLSKPAKGKGSKNKASSKAGSEWLEGTNVVTNEKKKEMPPKSSKKKKGQAEPQPTRNAGPAAAGKNFQAAGRDENSDSDSVDSDSADDNDNDSQFAARMQKMKNQPFTNKTTGNAAPAFGAAANATKGAFLQTGAASNVGLDGFTFDKPRTMQQRKQSVSLQWPLEGYDFNLVCRLCFLKQGEGAGGYIYRPEYQHNCSHDTLIVRDKSRPHLDWLKIRPRHTADGKAHVFKYKMCIQFQNHLPCRLGELNCTFAHNHAEVTLWNLDRDRVFSIQGFINDARRQEITSSQMLDAVKPQEGASERYIPGLSNVQGGLKRQPTSPPPIKQPLLQVPPSRPQGAPGSRGIAGLSNITLPPQMPTNSPSYPTVQPQEQFIPRPQNYFQTSNITSQPTMAAYNRTSPMAEPVYKQPFQSPTLPTKSPPTFSDRLPNLNQPPPSFNRIQNPFPGYKYQLFCSVCLTFSGKPWFYNHSNVSHQCFQNVLAYFVQNDLKQNCWVLVRERASHRQFKGNYTLCHSFKTGQVEQCKFKENCSFAHNVIEQNIWKLEQEGKFDISEFILQNKKQERTHGTSSNRIHVKSLMEKHGGYFRFICRDCFFAPRPMISSLGENNMCSGTAHHRWETSRIVAHVKQTTYTPIDVRKFVHAGAFYLLCNQMHFCMHWLANRCRFAHSQVERDVWMLERDTNISRDELVMLSINLFNSGPNQQGQSHGHNASGGAPSWAARAQESQRPSTPEQQRSTENFDSSSSINLTEFCRTCWGQGQRHREDVSKDKCVRGHSNFKLNSVFVSLPAGKEIRNLPAMFNAGTRLVLCAHHPKCTRPVCNHPHGQEELEVWNYMLKNKIKNLRELCSHLLELQKKRTRKISVGESVVSVWGQGIPASVPQSKSVNQIIAPGDLLINEYYCSYCGISCNSPRQWDEHCMSERHINNVNSDKEHQWNYRQPPWGQSNNLALCAKHMHNQSCQYSHVPDRYNLCKYAHSQEELDEWQERIEWRQLKRMVAKERHMFSYTESLLEEYYSKDNSVNVISETLSDVIVICNDDQELYRSEKNATFTWVFEVHTLRGLERVALLHNKDRLHFSLLSSDDTRHQVASGDLFLSVDEDGNGCYKVNVCFSGGMFGSFSQWVVFDFGDRPVLVKKLVVEIGDRQRYDRVKELREDLSFNRWTGLNREIVRAPDETLDEFTLQLLHKYKEPTASEEVVTLDSLAELNCHNYVHKMHKLLELEEITRHRIIAGYNLISKVTVSQTLDESGIFLIASNGDLFIKVILSENLTEDTLGGKLVLTSVRTVLLAPVNSKSNKVYEAYIVGENNYGYDGRGKEHIYIFVNAVTASALGLSPKKEVELEIQFQMDRKFFCRMHYALDSVQTTDVIFPDVVKFKTDINQLSSASKFRSSVLNDDQMTAVRHIVIERDGYTPPFIMYGPFGTGKTETLAQATMTLLKERQNVRILICTQSNSAADLYITKHLDSFFKKNRGKFRMLRLNAVERRMATVSEEVLSYSYAPGGKNFEYPSKEYIQTHHLVLTTVENSMQLTRIGLQAFFTHIFMDEAGQALECEILMPLTLATPKTCVVLTGDHHQIAPPVYSQEARRQKFDMSILVRLYNYYDQIANSRISQIAEKSRQSPLNIFLSINYRTKPEILRFISSVFYGGPDNLKAFGQIPSVMGITPLMFYAVQGVETQNADSTSYFNHSEAQEVFERVKDLLDNWPKEWGEFDAKKVAIISTYADQIKHLRNMFRQDRQRPYLRNVDIGPIHSFQGKEMRALFISTVRTTHLLEEPHIIRSLEAGEDIGDLGFLSNPKLLNTAFTRTQSFIGVVGDPVALCLIGECIQVWRTYLKHCSNMKSVRPQDVTYDYVRNQVVHIQVGPAGRVVSMISKRSQDSFKQSLQGKSTRIRHNSRNQEQNKTATEDGVNNAPMYMPGVEDLAGGDVPSAWMKFVSVDQPQPKVQSSITPEDRSRLRQSRQFIHDKLSHSSNINCEDIIFKLAKENQKLGEASDASHVKSEGIIISEDDGFAVLSYSSQNTSKRGPYTITSEDADFTAFVIHDEDAKVNTVYENWSIDTLQTKLEEEPEVYVKCKLCVEGARTYASVIGPAPPRLQALGSIAYEVEISGQLNRGHAFSGDTVVVQLLGHSESGRLEGQVKGILQRALDPTNRLFVCTSDPESTGILTPINPDIPRIYSLTSAARIKLARKGNVCVYKFVSSSGIEFSHYEHIDPADNANRLFIVCYLTWEPGFVLPMGVVVGMLNPDDSLDKGIQVLEIEHNIKRALRTQAMIETDSLFPQDFSLPADMLQNRQNFTDKFCFTISDPETEDLEMAISVSQIDNNYEVGIHVADVVAYVDKDSVLDQECEHRGGASLFILGKEPKHMLPTQVCTDFCSLKPGFDRLAISVIVQVNEQGKIFGQPDVFRSVINSKQRFSHAEVEETLLNTEEAQSDYLKSCIIVLYQLSYAWRCERLGNGHMFPDLTPGERIYLHSHLMMNEVRIRFNTVVAELLLSRFEETTPLLVQPAPQSERLEEWKLNNAVHAFNSIPMTRAFLEDKVCRCTRACTCVFSFMRKHHLMKNGDFVSMLKDRWLMICDAVGGDFVDFELAQNLISNPENMPQVAVANHRLKTIQQQERYVCSQDTTPDERKHYGLCVTAYTNFTNPLRRFISMVVQRLLIAYMEGAASPYGPVEIEDICEQATATEREVKKFNQAMFVMHLASAVKAHPLSLNALVEEVDKERAVVSFEGLTGMSQEQRTVALSLLTPAKISSQGQVSDNVQLAWEERVYEHAVRDAQSQYGSELKLDSDRFVCSISSLHWQRLIIAAREKDEAAMATCVQEITHHIGGEMELLSKHYPEVLSDISRDGQVKHFVPFSFTVHESQVLQVQLSVRLTRGLLVPSLQLLSLTPCLDICLEHRADPSNCFANPSLAKQAKVTYTDEIKYASEWLLPILALESAHKAVADGDRIIIHSISISWKTDRNVIDGDTVEGSFTLSEEFCSRSRFQPDLVSSLLDGRPLLNEDATFSLDYLCVRYKNLVIPVYPQPHESIAALTCNGQPITWVCHCRVTAVSKSVEGYKVKISIVKSNMRIPDELLSGGHNAALYTVEWIRKTWDHRIIDVAVRGLQHASSFAKEIVTGKKPFNTIDPVPQDNTIWRGRLSEEQETVIAESYRQPVTAVFGGPGSGKTQVAARLAHLLARRNQTADNFRQTRSDVYTTQLMICAPSEKSLDVITEHLVKLNSASVRIVRVYSEEIEERDFPVSLLPKPSSEVKPQVTCTVMKEVALHHLIRGKENAESKSLLEQEMMTMYGKQMATAVDASIRKAQTLEIRKAQIILCTCITSSRPILRQTANIKQIIMDDAGFISEAEAIVPLVMHRGVNQLVLIGDLEMPRSQIKNPLASQLGLSRPLLQRFSERAQRLTMQYRCPPQLCSFPSSQFYGGLLNTNQRASPQSPASTIPWPGDAGFPSVFCHVTGSESVPDALQGKCTTENDIVNTEECQIVSTLVGALVQRHKVNIKSILVLAVTDAQAALIRDTVPQGFAVSTVMDSVGRESEYVVLSTVRSLHASDLQLPPSSEWTKAHLGQLANPQMMNLAITRAKTALFVVGNKNLLATCEPWLSFLRTYRTRHSVQADARDFIQSLLLMTP